MMKLYVVPLTSQLEEVTIKLVCTSSATEMRFAKDIKEHSHRYYDLSQSPWIQIQMRVINN